jgi:hypothetical protein
MELSQAQLTIIAIGLLIGITDMVMARYFQRRGNQKMAIALFVGGFGMVAMLVVIALTMEAN